MPFSDRFVRMQRKYSLVIFQYLTVGNRIILGMINYHNKYNKIFENNNPLHLNPFFKNCTET